MGIPDRIILTLYTVLMAVVAVFIVLFALQIISPTTVYAFAATIPGRWEYAVGGVVLLLVSLRLLVTDDKEGRILVSKNAVEDYVSELTNDIYGVHNAKAVAKMVDNALNFRVNASIEPAINIPDTTDEMKQVIRKNVLATLGVEVKDVEVFFKHIQAKK